MRACSNAICFSSFSPWVLHDFYLSILLNLQVLHPVCARYKDRSHAKGEKEEKRIAFEQARIIKHTAEQGLAVST